MAWRAHPVCAHESWFPFVSDSFQISGKIGATEHHISPQNYSPQKRRGLSSREATMGMSTSPRKRNKDGRGLTSPASSCRSWKPLSRGTDTRTWAPERRSQCGPTSRRPGSGYDNHKYPQHLHKHNILATRPWMCLRLRLEIIFLLISMEYVIFTTWCKSNVQINLQIKIILIS